MAVVHRQTAGEALREAGSAARTDRPSLLPGITLVRTASGLIAYGGFRPQVFGGKSAQTVLPAVLRALDGTRTTAEVARQLGLPTSTVDAVCALARTRRLLGSGPAPADSTGRWLARSGAEATKPGAAKATVTGEHSLAAELADLLAADGVVSEVVDWADGEFSPGDSDLVAVVRSGPEPSAALAALDERLTSAGVPWLRIVVGADGAEIGPRFTPDDELRYVSWWPVAPPREPSAAAPGTRQAALGFAAVEIVNLLRRAGRPFSGAAVAEFDAATGACRLRPRVPRPPDGASICLAADYAGRKSTSDTPVPVLPEPDATLLQPAASADLGVLLDTAFPATAESRLNAYLLTPDGARLHRPGGLLDLSGVADEQPWLRRRAADALAAVAVSVTLPGGTDVLRAALLDAGAALQRLATAAHRLGYRVRRETGGTLGELGEALGILPHAETVLDVVVLEREPGGSR
ncbi:hypothetical protein F9C11_26685 [Amycolatopsis sp. VS8301801F10]|uniref:hypothetical protein n=1 Tax=Amycolatopsis sp. VS8301801F10 TaxID=2652442 RepID=UPI0038FC1C99